VTRRPGTDDGFTLLEVLVAMTLFAAGIVMVFELFSGALRMSARSRDASESAIYARQRMEEALLVPSPAEGKELGAFGEKYRWELTTVFVPQEEPKPYEEIRLLVTIRWRDGEEERSVEVGATRWHWKEENEGA